jgi:DNA-directed RNA polymerase subunit RPC12/RpoP
MAIITSLECPHCGKDFRTTKAIPPGSKVRCPQCRNPFHIVLAGDAGHEQLLEVIPIEGVSPLPVRDHTLPLRAPVVQPVTRAKPLDGKFREPFGHSRSLLAAIGIGFIVLAGYGFVSWYSGQVVSLSKAADAGADRRASKIKGLVKGVLPDVPSKKMMVVGLMTDSDRTSAPGTQQIEDIVVGVSSAVLGPITLRIPPAKNEFLTITLRVTNLGKKPLKYEGWMQSSATTSLRDVTKNYFNRINFPPNDQPQGRYLADSIEPSLTVTDVVIFETMPPSPMGLMGGMGNIADLELDLPYGEKTFKYRIPFTFIQRQPSMGMMGMMAPFQQPQQQEVVPPQPAPYNPEEDAKVCLAVRIAYREGLVDIRRKFKGMSYDRGRDYRKKALDTLIMDISDKYKLDEDQVKRILVTY